MMERADIAAAITADLEAEPGEAAAPSPEPASEATATATTTDDKAQDAAAPAAPEPEPPKADPVSLSDDTVIVDPSNGQPTTWGKLKSASLRHADYTRKTMELAEARRNFETERAKWQAEQQIAAARAASERALAALPQLPPDDPYTQHLAAIREQQQALLQAQQAEREALETERIAAARARLDAEEAKAVETYKLEDRERNFVGNELLRRLSGGDVAATYDSVAREYAEWREAQIASAREAAVREFKEKHRVSAPAAAAAAPAPGVATEMPRPGTRAMFEAMRDEVAALMR